MDYRSAFRAGGGLGEYAGAVRKGISNRCSELPEDLSEGFFELRIDDHMLIVSESRRGKLRKGRDFQIRILIPVGGYGTLGC